MDDDLDTLRPEVRGAVEYCDGIFDDADNGEWATIRAELLRLADSNATLDQALSKHVFRCTELQQRAEKSEAELTAIKAKIAEAPTAQLIDQGRAVQQWCVRATDGSLLALPPALSGKRVRLVVEE